LDFSSPIKSAQARICNGILIWFCGEESRAGWRADLSAESPPPATEDSKHWTGGIEGLWRASDQKNQFSKCRMRLGAGYGRIQETSAVLRRFRRKFINRVPV